MRRSAYAAAAATMVTVLPTSQMGTLSFDMAESTVPATAGRSPSMAIRLNGFERNPNATKVISKTNPENSAARCFSSTNIITYAQ